VLTVTRPLTQHDTTNPHLPAEGSVWPNGYMSSYGVHVGGDEPMVDTAEDMYRSVTAAIHSIIPHNLHQNDP
jgi:hypothetical protein